MFARKKVEKETYKLKNLLLGFPSDWFVNKDTLKKAKASIPNIVDFYKSEGTNNPKKLPLELLADIIIPQKFHTRTIKRCLYSSFVF